MKQRTFVRILSFSFALSTVILGYWLTQRKKTEQYRTRLGMTYQQSVQQLTSSLWDIDTDLEKLQYATDSEACSKLAVALMGRSQTAKTALSQIPNTDELTVINRFLSQVGNYAVWLADTRRENDWPIKDVESIAAMKKTSAAICQTVAAAAVDEGLLDDWGRQVEQELKRQIGETALAQELRTTEESLTDYPTLLYDGPYSDQIDTTERPLLDESPKRTSDEAKQLAMEHFGFSTELQQRADSAGKIPCYVLSDANAELDVSIKGGYPVNYRRYRTIETAQISATRAGEFADAFLKDCGFTGMVQTYYETQDGLMVFCYAYLDGVTVCYADLIKVGVALDDGEVLLLSTEGYLSHHRSRTVETPLISSDEAAQKIRQTLRIQSVKQTLIPLDNNREAPCYEFVCLSSSGRKLLVYLNTQTGKQEQLFLVEENPNGTFVK